MIEVRVEVSSGPDSFRTIARAESIEGALSAVKARHGSGEVRVLFPIDPEGFFAPGRGPVSAEKDALSSAVR